MPIEIYILHHTEETRKTKALDMDFDWSKLDVVPFYLIHFQGAHPVYNKGIEYTEIYLGGGATIISLLTYDEFKNLIERNSRHM